MTARALVVGAGPAGLMAAETMARAGINVMVAEAKPSVGRKFLMAGKSGLNLTKDEDFPAFAGAYEPPGWLDPILAGFGPGEVMAWARGLGQDVFTGSSGRVFPVVMKASPLLRAWLGRLSELGVEIETRWRWEGVLARGHRFLTPEGPLEVMVDTAVLAMGGGSWARLGSDGGWVAPLRTAGVEVADFAPANVGFVVDWSRHMARHFGQPVKGVALCLPDGTRERGEFVISAKGLEGGGIYAVSRALRHGAALALDLVPDLSAAEAAVRLARGKSRDTIANRLRKLGLSATSSALVQEFGRPLPPDPFALSVLLKALPVPLLGPRPIDGAISTAGGVTRAALTAGLELRALPGVHACGEMLDWEAPTGGYLLTACLATGLWAGRHAAEAIAGR
jgi:uncharacterized flavoprotein (TIGR03862 family)